MVNLIRCSLAVVAAAQVVAFSPAFQLSLDQLRQSHRIKQVDAGRKLPAAIAMANVYAKYKKAAPPHILHAAMLASRDLAAAAATSSTTSTSTPKTTTSATKTTTTSTTTTTTSTATKSTSTTSTTSKTTLTTSTTSSSSKTTSTATSNTSAGVVQASNIANDRQYLVNVVVGKTSMLLNFDTGSSDFWVTSTLLPASQRGNHTLYPISSSNDPGATFQDSYGEGSSVSGVINVDSVTVGGVTATVQAIGAATSISTKFVSGQQDGIVGLGFIDGSGCAPSSCYNLIHQLAGVLPKTLFTATLKHNAPGEYDLGFIDSSKYTGSLVYTDVTDIQGVGYWEFLAQGYSVGNGAQVSGNIDAIADTGTTLNLLDDSIVNAYYANVPGAVYNDTVGGVIFPCSSISSLPSLSFYIRTEKRTMPSGYGVYATLSSPSGYCFGGIQSNNGMDVSILGDVFLKSQFVVFDFCLQRLGFAQQAGVTV